MVSFLPTCPLLFWNWSVFEGWKGLVRTFWPKKVGFCPFIFQKWAGGNRCGTRVCGFSAHFPTFSLHLNAKKNKEKYIKWKIKVGFWPEDSCRSDFRHSPVKFSSIRLLPFLFFLMYGILTLRHNSIFLSSYEEIPWQKVFPLFPHTYRSY